MSDEKPGLGEGARLGLAVVLSMVVMGLWLKLFPPPEPTEPPADAPAASAPADPSSGAVPDLAGDAAGPLAGPTAGPTAVPGSDAPAAEPRPDLAAYPEVTVRTTRYEARFSTLGAVQTAMVLEDFAQTHEPDSPPVHLIDGRSTHGAFAFDLFARDGKRRSTADIEFAPSTTSLELAEGEEGSVVFTGRYPGIGTIEKEYAFRGGDWAYQLDVRVIPDEDAQLDWAVLSLDETGSTESSRGFLSGGGRWELMHVKVDYGRDIDSHELGSLRKDARKGKLSRILYNPGNGKAPVRWGGFDEHYFLRVVLPEPSLEPLAQVEVKPRPAGPASEASDPVQLDLVSAVRPDPETGVSSFGYQLFMGPKSLDVLRATDPTLPASVEFGWFPPLSRFFVDTLRFFHGFLGNWGFSIILLTIIVRMLLFPLTLKSMQSMERMRELQPELNAIREKLKDDPEKMQREWMAIYKRNKVNPLGGCLPMLMQFPIFIGLYYALAQAIELRHADFAFWLTDLSAPDPYYVTPVLMGASMLLLQRMQPMTAMDPMQQKVLQWMPVMFTFFFLSFPSGLVLYWLFSNLVSIGQQYWIRHRKGRVAATSAAGGAT